MIQLKRVSDEEVWLRMYEAHISKTELNSGWKELAKHQVNDAASLADYGLERFRERFRCEYEEY